MVTSIKQIKDMYNNWAKVNSDNIVVDVQVYEIGVTPESELPEGWSWVLDDETIKNDAGVGKTYDVSRQAFIAPNPFTGWILNEDTCQWEPPTPTPTEGNWIWDNNTQSWTELG